MLTQQDYANLAVLVSRAQFNGINEATAGLQLFEKLKLLAAPQQEDKPSGDSTDRS